MDNQSYLAFEGGQAIGVNGTKVEKAKLKERAVMRLHLESQVKVSVWHKTLFFGLRHNHPHNVAVVHPLAFVLRRLLFATLIIAVD